MTKIDQFESAFRAADKTTFEYHPVEIRKALVITDLDDYEAKLFGDKVRRFLAVLGDGVEWRDVAGAACNTLDVLFELLEQERADLICTYRHLHSGAWKWPYGLGEHLDVLTQITSTPVLVLPRPEDEASLDRVVDTNSVMAMTSHLVGDHRLLNHAVRFTSAGGTLWATHIENEKTFERYVAVIARIPAIDTEAAREAISKQLLKEARDYISSSRGELERCKVPLTVEEIVTVGRHLADHKRLVEDRQVDLLVFNTKDDEQLAMHGLAYPLAVELRQLPLLML